MRIHVFMILVMVLLAGTHAAEASEVAIGSGSISLGKGWEDAQGQDWVATRSSGEKTIGFLMVKNLGKSATDEAEEMASITDKNKALKTLVKKGVMKTDDGREIAYVYLSLNASDRKVGIESPMGFYSWYVPQEVGCVTIKLKCNMSDAPTLAEEMENALRRLSK